MTGRDRAKVEGILLRHSIIHYFRHPISCLEALRSRAGPPDTFRHPKLVQAGYAQRVLRTFGLWDCHPVGTPLDPNIRLTKKDSPEAVDPRLHKVCAVLLGVSHIW